MLDRKKSAGVFGFVNTIIASATPLGVDMIRTIRPHLRIPFTVMGGINVDNLADVLDAGARIVAVVTAVTLADNMVEAVRSLRRRIVDARHENAT